MTAKLSYEYVKNYVESKGCELISKKYINSRTKLEVRCPKGHLYKTTWSNFVRQGCPICKFENRKLTYDYVKKEIESDGYKLISKTFNSKKDKLKIICPKGHVYKTTWNNFKSGNSCKECFNEKFNKFKSENTHLKDNELNYKFIKQYVESFEYKLLSKEYISWDTKLKFKCDKNHIYYATWSHFKSGNRCPKCCISNKLTYEYVKSKIEKVGYKLLSTAYKNSISKL